MPSFPGLPGLPGLESVGDLSNIGNPGPSSARQQGTIEGTRVGGPRINIVTGGGSITPAGGKSLIYIAIAGAVIAGIYFLRK